MCIVVVMSATILLIFENSSTVFAPDIDVHEYLPFLFLESVHNTPIEGLWHWFTKMHGVNLKLLIQSGKEEGIYHANKVLEIDRVPRRHGPDW